MYQLEHLPIGVGDEDRNRILGGIRHSGASIEDAMERIDARESKVNHRPDST
jgi:hypothetical protein